MDVLKLHTVTCALLQFIRKVIVYYCRIFLDYNATCQRSVVHFLLNERTKK